MAKNFKAWPDQWPQSLNYPEQPVYNFLNQTAARIPNLSGHNFWRNGAHLQRAEKSSRSVCKGTDFPGD